MTLICNAYGVTWAKDILRLLFKLTDVGEAIYDLGVAFGRKENMICILEEPYCRRVKKPFGMDMKNSVSTPMVLNMDTLFEGAAYSTVGQGVSLKFPYREPLGSLFYLSAHTRPETTFVLNVLSCFVHCPHDAHRSAAKSVLRYLDGTTYDEIMMEDVRGEENGQGRGILWPYSCGNSDWPWFVETKSSTSENFIVFRSGMVS